jgi:hypothetical protein
MKGSLISGNLTGGGQVFIDGAKRKEAEKAFKHSNIICSIVNKSYILGGTAALKIYAA